MDERDPDFYSSEGDYSSSSSIFAVLDMNESFELYLGSGEETTSHDQHDFFELHYSRGEDNNINISFVPLTDDQTNQEQPGFEETQNILEASEEDTATVEDNLLETAEINVGDCTNSETSTLQNKTEKTRNSNSINKSKLNITQQKDISETAIVTRSRARLMETQPTISAQEEVYSPRTKRKLSLRPRNAKGLVEKKKK